VGLIFSRGCRSRIGAPTQGWIGTVAAAAAGEETPQRESGKPAEKKISRSSKETTEETKNKVRKKERDRLDRGECWRSVGRGTRNKWDTAYQSIVSNAAAYTGQENHAEPDPYLKPLFINKETRERDLFIES